MAAASSQNIFNNLQSRNTSDLAPMLHQEYVDRSEKAITRAVQIIRVNDHQLQKAFYQILDCLGEERKKIAEDSRYYSETNCLFGVKRISAKGWPKSLWPQTTLEKQYQNYGTLMMQRLHREMKQMKYGFETHHEKIRIVRDFCFGRNTEFKIEVMDSDELKRLIPSSTPKDLLKRLRETEEDVNPTVVGDVPAIVNFLTKFKKHAPQKYKELKLKSAVIALWENFPLQLNDPSSSAQQTPKRIDANLKSVCVFATMRLEINKKMYAMSHYLTWMYYAFDQDPVDRMLENSKIIILHHDVFLIEDTLKDVVQIFEQALKWKKEDGIEILKDRVALLRFELAHIMVFSRGSAAVNEWIEKSIYRYHGFKTIQQVKGKMADLEALTSLKLSEFSQAYDSTIELGDMSV